MRRALWVALAAFAVSGCGGTLLCEGTAGQPGESSSSPAFAAPGRLTSPGGTFSGGAPGGAAMDSKTTQGWNRFYLRILDGRAELPPAEEWKLDVLTEFMAKPPPPGADPDEAFDLALKKARTTRAYNRKRARVARAWGFAQAGEVTGEPELVGRRSQHRLAQVDRAIERAGGDRRKAARALLGRKRGRPSAQKLSGEDLREGTLQAARQMLLDDFGIEWGPAVQEAVMRWAQGHGYHHVLLLAPAAKEARSAVLRLIYEASKHCPAPEAEELVAASRAFLDSAGSITSRLQRPSQSILRVAQRLLSGSDLPEPFEAWADVISRRHVAAVVVLLGHPAPAGPMTPAAALKSVSALVFRHAEFQGGSRRR